jgi:hypothetical protein
MTQKSDTGADFARAVFGAAQASVEKDPGFFASLRMTQKIEDPCHPERSRGTPDLSVPWSPHPQP